MEQAIQELRKLLEKCWDETTIWHKGEFDPNRISAGQCYVTSLVLYDIFGGDLVAAEILSKGEYLAHYWFKLPNGNEFDLTSDQFGGDGLHRLPDEVIFGQWTVWKPYNMRNRRYLKLKQKIIREFFRNVYKQD